MQSRSRMCVCFSKEEFLLWKRSACSAQVSTKKKRAKKTAWWRIWWLIFRSSSWSPRPHSAVQRGHRVSTSLDMRRCIISSQLTPTQDLGILGSSSALLLARMPVVLTHSTSHGFLFFSYHFIIYLLLCIAHDIFSPILHLNKTKSVIAISIVS